MTSPARICFQLQIAPELLAEYIERHTPVWPEMLAEIADVLQDALGWTGEERDAEIQDTVDTLRTYHGVDVGATKVAADATVTEFAN